MKNAYDDELLEVMGISGPVHIVSITFKKMNASTIDVDVLYIACG